MLTLKGYGGGASISWKRRDRSASMIEAIQRLSIFDRTFDLGDGGLGGCLGLGRSFGLAFRSTAGLAGFRHGRRRLMKEVGGC